MGRPTVPRRIPTIRVGNYTAPVDTTGMDPEMIATMGIQRMRQPGDTTGVAKAAPKKPFWHDLAEGLAGTWKHLFGG